MTGFMEKIFHTVKGAANDAADALDSADAGRSARQDVRDLQAQITKADSDLLDVKAEGALLRAKINETQTEIDRWTTNAKKALDANDDALARDCLGRKQPLVASLADYQRQLAPLDQAIGALDSRINELRAHRDEMARQTEMLAARASVASATEKAAVAAGAIDGSGAVEHFKQLNDAVAKREARAAAAMQQADTRNGHALEDRVAALDAHSSIDDELAQMKAAANK